MMNNPEHNDIFLNRLLDVLRDHTDPMQPTESEATGVCMWSLTTPQEFLKVNSFKSDNDLEAEIREQVGTAMTAGHLDRVLFLALCLARLPQYRLKDSERTPWGKQ